MCCNCHQSTTSEHSLFDVEKALAEHQAELAARLPSPDAPQPAHAATARQLCREGHIKLGREAEAILDDELTPQAFFKRLLSSGHLAEARRVLALSLPKRRALWWACLCTQDAYENSMPPQVAESVEAVVRFIGNPSETHRRDAERVGRCLPSSRLEACLAMAAFFSEGNISLPHLPPVYPRPYVTGRLVGVCVYLASVTRSPGQYKAHLRQYLEIGTQIARGENLWIAQPLEPVRLDPKADQPVQGMHLRRTCVSSDVRPERTANVAR